MSFVLVLIATLTTNIVASRTCTPIMTGCCVKFGEVFCDSIQQFPPQIMPTSIPSLSGRSLFIEDCTLTKFNYAEAKEIMPRLESIVFHQQCVKCRDYKMFHQLHLIQAVLCGMFDVLYF